MIGVFDSGVGGLTVIKEILKESPGIGILYFGDTARLPYGTKSKRAILKYSKENTDFLIKMGAKAIVIACNTSSAIAANYLKKKFNLPVFDVINPAVRLAVGATKNKKIGIIATPATIKSGVYQKKIKKLSKNRVKTYTIASPLLVPLIEEGWLNNKITKQVVREYLKPLKKKKIDVLLLGCTHYPLIEKLISKEIGKNVKIINSATAVAKEIKNLIKSHKKFFKKGELKIFLSDEGYNFNRMVKFIFGEALKYKIVKPL